MSNRLILKDVQEKISRSVRLDTYDGNEIFATLEKVKENGKTLFSINVHTVENVLYSPTAKTLKEINELFHNQYLETFENDNLWDGIPF